MVVRALIGKVTWDARRLLAEVEPIELSAGRDRGPGDPLRNADDLRDQLGGD